MKDTAEQLQLNKLDVGNIKGHTKIILTDVRTGKKKVVEHDNTFQSAFLANQLRSFGMSKNSPWNNSTWANRPLWRNLCGGIFLFRDAITAPCEYMPAGNLMVANGAYGISNSDVPVELGSYNSIESSTSGANISFVYDWGTAQGNGTIGCICLTSELGGYIGYGNASGASAATLRSLTYLQSSEWQYIPCANIYDGKKYGVTDFDTTNKKITVSVTNDQITIASIVFWQNTKSTQYSYTGDVLTGSGNNIVMKPITASKFAVVKGTNATIANGETARILTFDCSTAAVGYIPIMNTSGVKLVLNWQSGASLKLATDSSGNIFVHAENDKIAKFDSAGVFVDFIGDAISGNSVFGMITPDIIASEIGGSMLFYDGTSQKPTNGEFTEGRYVETSTNNDILFVGSDNTLKTFHNPFYLATINNLQTPVVKDSTQTMKVIYTLTEA